jgi:hypothetical protein
MRKRTLLFTILCLISSLSINCTTYQGQNQNPNSALTTGMVKMKIIKGQTTQSEILNLFGSPNLTTLNSEGQQVWNYNRMSYQTQTSADGASLLFWGGSRAVSTSTTKSFDLIITFDDRDIVKTYSVISASY